MEAGWLDELPEIDCRISEELQQAPRHPLTTTAARVHCEKKRLGKAVLDDHRITGW